MKVGFILLFLFGLSQAKVFTRCGLAKELVAKGIPRGDIDNWVCLVESESSRNTKLKGGPNKNKSYDHGLFQINDRYWCKNGHKGGDCKVSCEDLSTVLGGFGAIFPKDLAKFYLVSKGDPLSYTLISNNATITPGWLKTKDSQPAPLAVIIHGLGGHCNASSSYSIAKALLENNPNLNCITLDYSKAVQADYLRAVSNVLPVAKKVAKWLTNLINDGHATPENVTLIGFSLGAHVAGIAGNILKTRNYTVGKIIALDPALPSFESASEEERLTKDDAEQVMVLHTTGGNVAFADPLGHIDFYPNGGTDPQPMCIASRLASMMCSHSASYKYLAESIENGGFEATQCDNWLNYEEGKCEGNPKAFMSINIDKRTEGKYYLKTRSEPPYGDILVADDPVENLVQPTLPPNYVPVSNDNKSSATSFWYNSSMNIIFITLSWCILR